MSKLTSPKRPAWAFISLLLLFLLLLAAVTELTARIDKIQRHFPYLSMGNFHYQFEIKWFRLQQYVQDNGGVDVILLGSSLVNTGIDPDVMAQAYFEQTGVRLRIFNFGVEGLTVAPNSVNAKILVERYHPALLIYVTEMRDFVAGNGLEYETRFLADPWLRYENGQFNLDGWLIDHSTALQHYLPYRNWMRADFLETMPLFQKRSHDTTLSGYEMDHAVGQNIDVPPDPNNPADAQEFAAYQNYQMAASRLADLKSILDLRQNGETAMLVVEMPVHPTFYVFVGGEAVHQEFQQDLSAFVQFNGGLFLPAEACNDIPLEGRSNRWHLNYIGAPIFSRCLGRQLATIAAQQQKDYINRTTGGSK